MPELQLYVMSTQLYTVQLICQLVDSSSFQQSILQYSIESLLPSTSLQQAEFTNRDGCCTYASVGNCCCRCFLQSSTTVRVQQGQDKHSVTGHATVPLGDKKQTVMQAPVLVPPRSPALLLPLRLTQCIPHQRIIQASHRRGHRNEQTGTLPANDACYSSSGSSNLLMHQLGAESGCSRCTCELQVVVCCQQVAGPALAAQGMFSLVGYHSVCAQQSK